MSIGLLKNFSKPAKEAEAFIYIYFLTLTLELEKTF